MAELFRKALRVGPLLIAAILPTDVKADEDTIPSWYADARSIVQQLISQEVGSGTAQFVMRQSPAACYYLRNTLERAQEHQWSNFTDTLRADLRSLAADMILWRLTAPAEGQSHQTFKDFLDAFTLQVNTEKYKALVSQDQPEGSVCTPGWWREKVGNDRIGFFENQCLNPATQPSACHLALALMEQHAEDAREKLLDWLASSAVETFAPNSTLAERELLTQGTRRWLYLGNDSGLLKSTDDEIEAIMAQLQGVPDPNTVRTVALEAERWSHRIEVPIGDPKENFRNTTKNLIESVPKGANATSSFVVYLPGTKEKPIPIKERAIDDVIVALEQALDRETSNVRDDGNIKQSRRTSLEKLAKFATMASRGGWQGASGKSDFARTINLASVAFRYSASNPSVASSAIIDSILTDVTALRVLTSASRGQAKEIGEQLLPALLACPIDSSLAKHESKDNSRKAAGEAPNETPKAKSCDETTNKYKAFILASASYALAKSDSSDSEKEMTQSDFIWTATQVLALQNRSGIPGARLSTFSGRTIRGGLGAFLTPELGLQMSWNEHYKNRSGSNGFRNQVSAYAFGGSLTIGNYWGFRLTLVDYAAPASEYALRQNATYKKQGLIFADLIRPRIAGYFFVPQLTRHVSISGGLGWRVVAAKPDGDKEFSYEWQSSGVLDLSAEYVF